MAARRTASSDADMVTKLLVMQACVIRGKWGNQQMFERKR
jgi:hypothetical protein